MSQPPLHLRRSGSICLSSHNVKTGKCMLRYLGWILVPYWYFISQELDHTGSHTFQINKVLIFSNKYNEYKNLKFNISIFAYSEEASNLKRFPQALPFNSCCIHVRQLVLPGRSTHRIISLILIHPPYLCAFYGEPSNTLERYWHTSCYRQQWLHSATAQDLFPSKWKRPRCNSSEFSI